MTFLTPRPMEVICIQYTLRNGLLYRFSLSTVPRQLNLKTRVWTKRWHRSNQDTLLKCDLTKTSRIWWQHPVGLWATSMCLRKWSSRQDWRRCNQNQKITRKSSDTSIRWSSKISRVPGRRGSTSSRGTHSSSNALPTKSTKPVTTSWIRPWHILAEL